MTLNEAFFVTSGIHQKEVELPDGSKHILHFREVPAADWRKFSLAERSEDPNVHAESIQRIVAASLCEADGKPTLTVEKAMTLTFQAANALFHAVLAVHGRLPKEKKETPADGDEGKAEAAEGNA